MMHTHACPTLADQKNHTIKKVKRKNNKPRKLNTYILRLQELKAEIYQHARRRGKLEKTKKAQTEDGHSDASD